MEALMMEKEMSSWNDDRLDELNQRVENGFAKVDRRFERVEGEMKERFAEVRGEMKLGFAQTASREEMGEVKTQLDRVNDRIDRLMYTMMATGVGMVGTVVVGVVGLILRG
jgi:hypothetical protein